MAVSRMYVFFLLGDQRDVVLSKGTEIGINYAIYFNT